MCAWDFEMIHPQTKEGPIREKPFGLSSLWLSISWLPTLPGSGSFQRAPAGRRESRYFPPTSISTHKRGLLLSSFKESKRKKTPKSTASFWPQKYGFFRHLVSRECLLITKLYCSAISTSRVSSSKNSSEFYIYWPAAQNGRVRRVNSYLIQWTKHINLHLDRLGLFDK